MNYLKKILFAHLFIVISFLVCSCGASHSIRDDVIYKDDNFSYNNLLNNDLVNGGVFSHIKSLTYDDKIQGSFLLSKILYEQLKDVHTINMITTGQFITEIGKENYLIIMDNIEFEGILNNESIGIIRESMPNLNYLIFAYIRNENIIDYSDTERVKNEKGEEEYKTDYEKTYLLTVEFQIYDVLQEYMVYNIVVYNQAEQTETRTTQTGCCEGGISSLISDIFHGPPAEINREEVLAKIYEKFAEELVKTKN